MPFESSIEIFFVVDGKDYARRRWPAVPPVGARVMMHPIEGPATYVVERVTWGVNKDDVAALTCNVDMKIEPRRGRPVGTPPFDKKKHDRDKARERRAAKKVEAKPK